MVTSVELVGGVGDRIEPIHIGLAVDAKPLFATISDVGPCIRIHSRQFLFAPVKPLQRLDTLAGACFMPTHWGSQGNGVGFGHLLLEVAHASRGVGDVGEKGIKICFLFELFEETTAPFLEQANVGFARLYQLLRDESIGIHAMQVINGDMLDMVKKASKLQTSMFLFDFIAYHVPMTVHTNFIMASSRVYVADVFQGIFFF